jgi:hypothetical protein
MQTSIRPWRWAFFAPGPLGFGPRGNGVRIAFTGPLGGLLGTPAEAPEEGPDAGGTRGEAKVAVHACGDAFAGPECIAEAMGTSTLAQQGDEALALLRMQCGVTATGMGLGVEARLSMVGNSITPAADGTGRRFDVSGHLADTPANLQQRDSHATLDFEVDRGALRSHGAPIDRINWSL